MPQEPKKRHSRARQGKRRAAIHLKLAQTILCPNCQTPVLTHMVCKKCGFYKGQEVIAQKKKTKTAETKETNEHTHSR